MTPVLEASGGTLTSRSADSAMPRRSPATPPRTWPTKARLSRESARYRLAADRLARALESPRVGRSRLLLASPAVLERSGRSRTLVEMIEAEPDDDEARLRLAKLLLRALVWRPETFPYPADDPTIRGVPPPSEPARAV